MIVAVVDCTRTGIAVLDVRRVAAEDPPYPADTFDMALAQFVVHSMADPAAGLRAMTRVIHAGVVAGCGAGSVETPVARPTLRT